MDHYLWCIACDIIKPKPRIRQPKNHVWVCKYCGNEVSEMAVPKGSNPVSLPVDLFKIIMDQAKQKVTSRLATRKQSTR